jgi:hypothetical protein
MRDRGDLWPFRIPVPDVVSDPGLPEQMDTDGPALIVAAADGD